LRNFEKVICLKVGLCKFKSWFVQKLICVKAGLKKLVAAKGGFCKSWLVEKLVGVEAGECKSSFV